MLETYLVGNGIDASREHHISGAYHKYIEPGNFYLLRNEVGVETADFLYAKDLINETKYYRILLYEWFLVIKVGGYLIIEFEDNEILDYSILKKEIELLRLYGDRYEFVEEEIGTKRKNIVLRKTKSINRNDDEINNWTFGIVTNGRRKELIETAIKSIRNLRIPHYEIIICGTYYGEIVKDIRYIPFTERDDKGWITKKKNIICENAKYENIVVIHDRIFFDKDWFDSMKKWGIYFEVLSCPVILFSKNEIVISNWETLSENFKFEDEYKLFRSNGTLDLSDWDKNVIVSGAFIILKKYIWMCEKWNENLFWGEAEDIEFSFRQHKRGIMIRLNPYSKVYASTVSGITFKAYYEKNTKKLGKFHCGMTIPTILVLKTLDFLGFRRNQKTVKYFIRSIKKFYNSTSWKDESGTRK